MPHIIVKLWPGRPDELKKKLAEKIAEDVAEDLSGNIGDVSVSFEDIPKEKWVEEVVQKDIREKADKLYKKPEYDF